MINTKRTFVKKGDKIILKTIIPDEALSSKDMVEAVTNDEASLSKQTENITLLNNNIETNKKNIEITNKNIIAIEENLKKIKKFENWALKVQESKLKTVIDEVKQEIEVRVRDSYKYDDGLTQEENQIQMFHQYRQFIATSKQMAENIAPKVYKDRLYKAGFLDNPFKDDLTPREEPFNEENITLPDEED